MLDSIILKMALVLAWITGDDYEYEESVDVDREFVFIVRMKYIKDL